MPSTKIPNYIFRNNQNLGFSNQQINWGIDKPTISSASVAADLDKDGDLDLVINNYQRRSFYLSQQCKKRITVSLLTNSNKK